MKARYQIEHFGPGSTYLWVLVGGRRELVSDKMNLIECRDYIRESYLARGIEPQFKEEWDERCLVTTTQTIDIEESK